MKTKLAWIVTALAAATVSHAQATGRMENPDVGIAVVKPEGWLVAVPKEAPPSRPGGRIKDEDIRTSMGSAPAAPLFVFQRHPDTHKDLNPSIQVVLRPLGLDAGRPPLEILEAAVEPLRTRFPDFHFLSESQATTVGGLPAAFMKASYTITAEGGVTYATTTGLWVVPRGAFVFLIGTASPTESAADSEAVFQQFVKSIEIKP
jgi:hypothetical protein